MQEAILADRIIVIDEGKVLLSGSPKEVFKNVEEIRRIGLDVPDSTYLIYLLRQKGYDLDPTLLTTKEVVDAIWQLKSNN